MKMAGIIAASLAFMFFVGTTLLPERTPGSGESESTGPTAESRDNVLPGVAPNSVRAPVAPTATHEAAEATPRWQTPRIVAAGTICHPLSIAARGRHVVLLAHDPTGEQPGLRVYESHDQGQTWGAPQKLEGYKNGAVALDDDGNVYLLGMVGKQGKSGLLQGTLMTSDLYERVEWRIRRRGGEFSASETVFTAADGHAFLYKPAFFVCNGMTWAFAFHSKDGSDQARVLAAVGPATGCPLPISTGFEGGGSEQPSAWVRDEKTAGIVLSGADGTRLRHYVTRDGGKNWRQSDIRVNLPGSAPRTASRSIPLGLTRQQDRIVALVAAEVPSPAKVFGIEVESRAFQGFTLHSADLGNTWTTAISVTKAEQISGLIEQAINGQYCLHAAADKTFFSHSRSVIQLGIGDAMRVLATKENAPAVLKEFSMPMLVSDDGGDSWSDHHVLDALTAKATFAVQAIGGDENSTHVAVYRDYGACLVIRSFAPGRWAAPTTPLPPWFKEEKLPEPTKQEF